MSATKYLTSTGVNTLWAKVVKNIGILKDYLVEKISAEANAREKADAELEGKIGVKVSDVKVDGTTVVRDTVAEIDLSSYAKTDILSNYVKSSSLATINGLSLTNGGDVTIDLSLYKVVSSLPGIDVDSNKIYLVANNSGDSTNSYDEYIYLPDTKEWEKLGEYKATVDLTNYLSKDEAEEIYLNSIVAANIYLTKTAASSTYQPKGNYLTQHQSLSAYLTTSAASSTYLSKTDAASTYQVKGNYLTSHQSLADYLKSADAAKTYLTISSASSTYQAKGSYAAASHNHAASNITSGVLDVARGGTGKATLSEAGSAILNALATGSSDPTDADYYICQYAGGGTSTTTYHRRPTSALYNYMKSKLDSVYQPKGSYLTAHQSLDGYVNTVTTTGTGNAVTAISKSGKTITVTKGATFLTSHQDISGKANKATTLAGYGITDAKIANGTITLGSNTITPLTSHQSLSNYYTKTEVSNNFASKSVATTSANGLMSAADKAKLNNVDLSNLLTVKELSLFFGGVFILDTDDKLYNLHTWDTANNSKAVGVVLITTTSKFVIAPTYDGLKTWSGYSTTISEIVTTTDSSTALKDFAGSSNTDKIIAQLGTGNAPAAEYCRNYTFKNGKKGYLWSLGEAKDAYNNKIAIDLALSKIGGTAIPMDGYHWTSTQYDSSFAWIMYWSSGGTVSYSKSYKSYVRAVCAF